MLRTHSRMLCRFPFRSLHFDKIDPFLSSFDRLRARITKERNGMHKNSFRRICYVAEVRSYTSVRHVEKKGIRLAITGLPASHQRKEMASPADVTYLTGAQFPIDSAVNQSGAHFANFKNSQKIEGKAYDDNFFIIVIRTKKTFLRDKNKIWG